MDDHNILLHEHERRLNDHERRLAELAEADEKLAEIDAKLGQDITAIHARLDSGFSALGTKLEHIEGEAFRSIPGTFANQIAIHSLVWQVIGVVSAGALALFVAYVKFHH